MASQLQALEKFKAVYASFPYTEPVKRWKAAGKKVIGSGCSYVPEEIIYAAGLMPVRMTGDNRESGMDEADAWLHINTCSYERCRFQMALDGQFDFLDGFITTIMCDTHRRVLDVWRYLEMSPFIHLLELVQTDDKYAIPRYLDYFRAMIADIENHFGVKVTDDDLRRGIDLINRKRDLLGQLSDLRAADAPPVTGAEVMEIMNASFYMPVDEFCDLLEELLAEIKATNRQIRAKFRLMLSGGPLSNVEFVEGIEELGGIVVTDELCTGVNFWHQPVELQDGQSPLEAIAIRYHNKIPCPRRSPFELRLESGLELARKFRIDGMVLQIIRNCFPHGYHAPTLARHLEYYGYPVLQLEKEYGTGHTGQIRTRVQAFLESLEGRVRQTASTTR